MHDTLFLLLLAPFQLATERVQRTVQAQALVESQRRLFEVQAELAAAQVKLMQSADPFFFFIFLKYVQNPILMSRSRLIRCCKPRIPPRTSGRLIASK